MPGTLRGAEPVATMMSRRARSVCVSPSKTSTPPLPVSRAVPLIQSILFFLNRNSTPFVRPLTMRSLRACTCAMSMPMLAACPERRRAERDAPLLGALHDLQRMRVLEQRLGRDAAPDQAGAAERLLLFDDRDLKSELRGANRGHVAAGSGPDHDDVVFAGHFFREESGTKVVAAVGWPPSGSGAGSSQTGLDLEARDARLQLTALVAQLPVGLGQAFEALGGGPGAPERDHGHEDGNAGENGR